MAEHEPGNKINSDAADRAQAHEEILNAAPVVGPTPVGDRKDEFRKIYADPERAQVFSVNTPSKATAGQGFYGEGFGNDLFAPPIEFGGYPGGGYGGDGGIDPFSSPGRYQYGGGYGGFQSKEGWAYGRGKTNIDHMRIAQCRLLYKTEGCVQTIVHLLADFVVENIDLIHPDLTVHNFYQAWMTKIDLKDRLHRFVIDLLVTGNVFVWTQLAKLKTPEARDMKRGVAAKLIGDDLVVEIKNSEGKLLRDKTISVELERGVFAELKSLNDACQVQATAGRANEVVVDKAKGDTRNDPADPRNEPKAVEIPWRYTSLNPLQMEPRGSRFANEYYWVMLLNKRDLGPLSRFMNYRYYTDISTTKVNLPEAFKGKLSPVNRPGTSYAAELRLDADRLAVIQDITKTDYEDWATPQIYPAHKEVSFKRMLRQGEISAMESLKHMITLIKLGDTKEGFAPTPDQIERVAAALAGGSQTHHLIWDDLIDGQVLQPNIGTIFDPKKYQQVDKDIYAALGVAESVFSGSASYANSFMAIKLLLEKLETIRCKLESWLSVEVKKVAETMKFKRLPKIQWGLMSLRDENAERKLWLDLYDRGIVSDQSMLERFGTDFDIEAERQKLEKDYKELHNKEIAKPDEKFRAPVMVSRGPFNRDLVAKSQNQQKPQPGKSGRPVKTGTPQTKKRNTKPKGMGSVIKFQEYYVFATEALRVITDATTRKVVEAKEIRDSRSLTKAQKADLEELIFVTLATTAPDIGELTEDLVYNLLEEDDNLNELTERAASESCQEILSLYKSEASNASTKEERFELMCNAYAAINANLLEDNDGEGSKPIERGS